MERRSLQSNEEKSNESANWEVVRSLDLHPEDWLRATWRSRSPQPRPEPKPFDLQEALNRLRRIKGKPSPRGLTGYFELDWNKAEISISLSPTEAHFWLTAMTCDWPGTSPISPDSYFTPKQIEDLVDFLAQQHFTDLPNFSELISNLLQKRRVIYPQIVLPLYNLFSIPELIVTIHNYSKLDKQDAALYIESTFDSSYIEQHAASRSELNREQLLEVLAGYLKRTARKLLVKLVRGFKSFVLPYLTDTDIRPMQEQLRPILNVHSSFQVYKLASYLGMHQEVQSYLDYWQAQPKIEDLNIGPFDDFNKRISEFGNLQDDIMKITFKYACPEDNLIEIIFGLGTPELVNTYARQWRDTKTLLSKPEQIRGWLAHTEYSALDWISLSIIDRTYPDELLQTFIQAVKAPEVAPCMLELWLGMEKPQLARQWLEENPIYAAVGLIPVAAGVAVAPVQVKPNELIQAAIDFLRSMKRKGYESLIRAALARESPEVAAKVQTLVLEPDEPNYPPFDAATTPQWLQEGMMDLSRRKAVKSPAWVSFADLPPIAVGDRCLNDEQGNACLIALSLSTLDSPLPLVQHLKTHGQPQTLDRFVWSLFERWLREGAPSNAKWAMMALGLLGSDAIALKLTPLIRKYPLESQHQRAALGLECLRVIGTDTALMQINSIAQIRFKGLKRRAQACLEFIASERQLTAEQLEDRIIPDCGLDADGKRVFDFGSRQFHFALSSELKPLVRDEQGKLRANLPKPRVKDDAERAEQAIADWKLMKKQIGEIAKIQGVRLEQAMVTERRWTWQEFEALFVQHPLMIHLVRRLVWGSFDTSDRLTGTFRVAEDRTFANENDEEVQLLDVATVGIVHPLHLDSPVKAAWGEILSDYEIIPPFPQIGRDTYTLQAEEADAEEIKRFQSIQIPGVTLARMMSSRGWQRGALDEHGFYRTHYKYFAKANITVIVGDYVNQHVEQSSISGDDAIEGCLFVIGQHHEPHEYPAPGSSAQNVVQGSSLEKLLQAKRLPLREVPPLILSEVLRDLTAIVNAQ
jgi:hypothetical protein